MCVGATSYFRTPTLSYIRSAQECGNIWASFKLTSFPSELLLNCGSLWYADRGGNTCEQVCPQPTTLEFPISTRHSQRTRQRYTCLEHRDWSRDIEPDPPRDRRRAQLQGPEPCLKACPNAYLKQASLENMPQTPPVHLHTAHCLPNLPCRLQELTDTSLPDLDYVRHNYT